MNKFGKSILTLLCVFFSASHSISIHAAPPDEYEVKAAFIHTVAKYVEWAPSPAGTEGTMRLCVLGQNPFGKALSLLRNKKIGDLVWKIVPVGSETNLKECRVLFIADSASGNLEQILNGIKDSAVLTMGDTEGYADQGVMVNFYLEDNMVRIEINLESARRAGLKFSSKLLNVARIVSDHEGMQ